MELLKKAGLSLTTLVMATQFACVSQREPKAIVELDRGKKVKNLTSDERIQLCNDFKVAKLLPESTECEFRNKDTSAEETMVVPYNITFPSN